MNINVINIKWLNFDFFAIDVNGVVRSFEYYTNILNMDPIDVINYFKSFNIQYESSRASNTPLFINKEDAEACLVSIKLL